MRRQKIRPNSPSPGANRNQDDSYPLIFNRGIGAAIKHIYLSVPQIHLGLVILRCFLLLTLNLGHPFLFLISHPGGLVRCFATDQRQADRDKGNELKLFHI